MFVGYDDEVGTSGWRLGGSLGYTDTNAKIRSRDSTGDIRSYSAALYAGKSYAYGANRLNVMGGASYTHHKIETTRNVASLGQTLKADYSAHTTQLFAEVGYAIGAESAQGIEPYAGITVGQQNHKRFKESGGFAGLIGEGKKDNTTSTTLGLRAHSDFKLAGKDARVRGTLGWRHGWGDLSQTRTMAFEGSSSFTVAGAPLARNTALIGLQTEVALSRYSAVVFSYDGEFASGSRNNSASAKLRWAY